MTKQTCVFAMILGLSIGACSASSNDEAASYSDERLETQFDRLEIRSSGGMPWNSDGASQQCGAKYVNAIAVDGVSKLLSWDICRAADRRIDKGQRAVTDVELASIKSDLAKIQVSVEQHCGNDKPGITLEISQGQRTQVYHDDFYSSCPGATSGLTYAKDMDGLHQLMQSLVPDKPDSLIAPTFDSIVL